MEEKFLKQYEILFIKGKEDFIAAKYLLDGFHNHNLQLKLDIIFFHFQQCAEKFIKSILDFYGIRFPRTHDLDEIITILEESNIDIGFSLEGLIELTDYAVEGRYGIINDDLQDSEKYIAILCKLEKYIQKLIAK